MYDFEINYYRIATFHDSTAQLCFDTDIVVPAFVEYFIAQFGTRYIVDKNKHINETDNLNWFQGYCLYTYVQLQ